MAALRYTPSQARRAANLAEFVSKTGTVNPAGARDLQRLFASGDIIERIGQSIAPSGLRVDDLADAYTVWWIAAWEATRGGGETSSRLQTAAVRAQAAQALSAAPTILRASEADKQQLAESLLINAMMLETAVAQAKGDPGRLATVAGAASQGARRMGLDLSAMALTESGFVPIER